MNERSLTEMELNSKVLNCLSEKDIEDYLYENPGSVTVALTSIERWLGRQVKLPSGILDLIGIADTGHLVVVEIKKGNIDSDAIAQVCRYRADVQSALNMVRYRVVPPEAKLNVVACCVGIDVTDKAMFEANALGVYCHKYEINIEIETRGMMQWTEKKADQINSDLIALAESDCIQNFVDETNAGLETQDDYISHKLRLAIAKAKGRSLYIKDFNAEEYYGVNSGLLSK